MAYVQTMASSLPIMLQPFPRKRHFQFQPKAGRSTSVMALFASAQQLLRPVWISVVLAVLCSSCTSPVKNTYIAPITGALLAVRLQNRLESPSAISVDVESETDKSITSITARRQQSVPGQYADYLVALALPPEGYAITAIRTTRQGPTEPAELLSSITVPFDVKSSNPAYLGRLVLSSERLPSGGMIEFQDHFEEDTLAFRSALAPLRSISISRKIASLSLLAPAKMNEQQTLAVSKRQLTVEPLSAEAPDSLQPQAQGVFARFLTFQLPRAFAVNDAGGAIAVSGKRAADRAMRDCAQLSVDKPCRLLAVDNTLVMQTACVSPAKGKDSRGAAAFGCANQTRSMR